MTDQGYAHTCKQKINTKFDLVVFLIFSKKKKEERGCFKNIFKSNLHNLHISKETYYTSSPPEGLPSGGPTVLAADY